MVYSYLSLLVSMKNLVENRIAIIGGHLTPALSVLEQLQIRGYEDIIWIGGKYSQTGNKNTSPEYQVVKNKNIKFVELKAGKLWRKLTFKSIIPGLINFLLIPYGFIKAFFIILYYQPDLVLSFGGYLALPLVISSKLLLKKSITHEQTIVTGTTNKYIAKFADIILVSWEKSLSYFPKNKTNFVGLPLRRSIYTQKENTKIFDNNLPILFAVGGNQGSNTINWRLLKILPELLEHMNVIHLTGNSSLTQDFNKAVYLRESLSTELKSRYLVKEHAFDTEYDYAKYLASSDIVLSRAGANTIAEILYMGKLSVLIPIPWSSHNEQQLNAELVASTGLGFVIKQTNDLEPITIKHAIDKALANHQKGTSFSGQTIAESRIIARKFIHEDASQKFVMYIERLLSRQIL
jgi:UDP-N-acetylglucosamine--N-acetylmuramyl-(pentapeptide) pyrophosphoryl-undecaprenol N-acetylglucosamine transferase